VRAGNYEISDFQCVLQRWRVSSGAVIEFGTAVHSNARANLPIEGIGVGSVYRRIEWWRAWWAIGKPLLFDRQCSSDGNETCPPVTTTTAKKGMTSHHKRKIFGDSQIKGVTAPKTICAD